ncbi:hypothetical protein RE428_11430 [Marinobacter nanhaiticus D15-8W]|nr:hypothetical protein RE428_11430 [Marinobacter nanhaiticus D15-8W]
MLTVRSTIILAALAYLSGCASGAKMENMVYDGPLKQYDTHLADNMGLTKVSGGEETNPAWTSEIDDDAFSGALKESLTAQGLLSDNGRYQLEVVMVEVDQPMFGLDMAVTTHIKYILSDRENGNAVVMDETIAAQYTATLGDAFAAVKRLRLANEGSGKANITALLDKLSALQIDPGEISLTQ